VVNSILTPMSIRIGATVQRAIMIEYILDTSDTFLTSSFI